MHRPEIRENAEHFRKNLRFPLFCKVSTTVLSQAGDIPGDIISSEAVSACKRSQKLSKSKNAPDLLPFLE